MRVTGSRIRVTLITTVRSNTRLERGGGGGGGGGHSAAGTLHTRALIYPIYAISAATLSLSLGPALRAFPVWLLFWETDYREGCTGGYMHAG